MSKRRLISLHMYCGLDCYRKTIRATPLRVKEFPQVQLAIHESLYYPGFTVTDIVSGFEICRSATWGGAIEKARWIMLMKCKQSSWRLVVRKRVNFFKSILRQ